MTRSFERYVAIGDSTTEGLGDPRDDGRWRGWADRLAEHVAESSPELRYANLAVRGKLAGQIRAKQLEPAIRLRPDLASLITGLNDALRPRFDVEGVSADIEAMLQALADTGATVVTFTFPDPVRVMPLARFARPRLRLLNETIREAGRKSGAVVVDMERHDVASDPRMWCADRLHPSPEGHRRIAAAAAEALGLDGADDAWTLPLSAETMRAWQRVAAEVTWSRRYLAPALLRRGRGRSSGDRRGAKRPQLIPVDLRAVAPQ